MLKFAWQVAQSSSADGEDAETHLRVVPTRVVRRGPPPAYRGFVTVSQEHAAVATLVGRLKAHGIAAEEIGILYSRNEGGRVDALCRELRRSHEVCWVSNESDPNGGVGSLSRPGVRLLTIHEAKGPEFPAVIVTGLDMLPGPQRDEDPGESNLLYVALTRAMDYLMVTWAGRSAFTEKVRRSSKAVEQADL